MKRRRIFLLIGICVLLASWTLCRDGQANSTCQSQQKIYHVKKGDSLAKIASKTGVSIVDLREINRLIGIALKIGQKIELYRSQDSEATEKARFMEIQVKSELESEEEGDGDTIDDGAWTDVERYEQGNAAPFGQWSNPEEQRLLVNVAIGFLGAPYRWGGFDYRGRLFGICEKNLSVLQHQSSPNRL